MNISDFNTASRPPLIYILIVIGIICIAIVPTILFNDVPEHNDVLIDGSYNIPGLILGIGIILLVICAISYYWGVDT